MNIDFMIIGAQKCGTTTLFNTLAAHPALVACRRKEPHFFSTTESWRDNIDAYHALFEQREGARYFEASTTYTFYPLRNLAIWRAIHEYNPAMKFIYLVREPIARITSGYMHTFERGYTDRPFEEALVEERLYIDLTRYHTQIAPYIKTFGREQVLIIDFDDLVTDRETVLRRVAAFIDIDPAPLLAAEFLHLNTSVGGRKKLHHRFDAPSLPLRLVRRCAPALWRRLTDNSRRHFSAKPRLSPDFRSLVVNMLELEVLALQELMNKDLSAWLAAD
ncbi:MAG: sulfotransferase [Gammaproteobacteria bacterium]|nr:sulfotransferase [Gammaproteobacteria bacterium]